MAITSVKETWEEETSRDGIVRDYTRTYVVKTDSSTDTSVDVRRHASIPSIGNLHPRDAQAICRSVGVRHLGNRDPYNYEVTVRYSSAAGRGSQVVDENPLNRPARRSVYAAIRRETFDRDESTPKKAVCNSAGVPFNPLPDRDVADLVYTVQKNYSGFSAATASAYYNAVNDDIWNGIAIGKAKLMQWSGTLVYEGSTSYWEHNFEICIRDTGWDLSILNVGRSVIVDLPSAAPPFTGVYPIYLVTEEGERTITQEDQVLTADGRDYLRPGTFPDDSHYITFRPYKRLPFVGTIPE